MALIASTQNAKLNQMELFHGTQCDMATFNGLPIVDRFTFHEPTTTKKKNNEEKYKQRNYFVFFLVSVECQKSM